MNYWTMAETRPPQSVLTRTRIEGGTKNLFGTSEDTRVGRVPRLIPELICSDLQAGLAFYGLQGFQGHPYGRGIDLTIDVDDIDRVHTAIRCAGHELYLLLVDLR